MIPTALVRTTLVLLLLSVALLLQQCNLGGSEVIGYRGGSEVIGQLVDADSLPVENAEVKVCSVFISIEDGILTYDTIVIDSTISRDNGEFIFDSIPPSSYFLTASYSDDSLVLPPYSFSFDSTSERVNLSQLVMLAPGAISGVVYQAEDGPASDINCYIAGTSFSAITNSSTPEFTITGIFPVDTSYTLTVSASGYRRVEIEGVEVKAGTVTILPDTIGLEIDPDGSPTIAPERLTVTYDTVSGTATAVWNRVSIEDVERYIVYHCNGSTCDADTVSDTMATITIFSDPDDTVARTELFQVAAFDDDNNEGPRSPFDTVEAIPPAWLRISTSIVRLDDLGTIDTAYVAMSFTGRITSVVAWTWWADDPDSVIESWSGEGLLNGRDTIVWPLASDKKRLYVSLTDDRGGVTVDSIDARSLLPIDVWVNADSLTYQRSYACAAAVDEKLYVFGGGIYIENGNGKYACHISAEQYDIATGTWTMINSMNTRRYKAASAVVDGKIYVFGGSDGVKNLTTVEQYDPETGLWEIIDTMDYAAVGASATAIDGIIYITGGLTGTIDSNFSSPNITTYNPANGEWGTLGTLASGRQLHQTVTDGTRLISIGGLNKIAESDVLTVLSSFECTTVGSVEDCPLSFVEITDGRFGFGAEVVADKLVLFGGSHYFDRINPISSVDVFSINGNESTAGVAMPKAVEGMATVAVNGRIYCMGGDTRDDDGPHSCRAVYVYYP